MLETNLVFKHAYEGYMHRLNGHGKEAVQSFTKMYKDFNSHG